MKETGTALRAAYYSKLNGQITIAGNAVPIYDLIASDTAAYPYIILSTQTENDESVKETFIQKCTLLIDVVTGFAGSGGRAQAEQISGQILALINPMQTSGYLTLAPDFKVLTTQKISGNDLTGVNGSYKIFRKLIRFLHIIQQLT